MKKIQLGGHTKRGIIRGYALVDDEDYSNLNKYKWSISKGYALRHLNLKNKRTMIPMHRQVMGSVEGQIIDHINGNRLDNRRKNLRFCTVAENNRNRRVNDNNKAGYKGIYFYFPKKCWLAQIKNQGRVIRLGYFYDKIKAARAYNEAAKKYFGEFARPNKIMV